MLINFHNTSFFLGFKDIRHGLVGCIDSIRFSMAPTTLHVASEANMFSVRFSGVEPGCPRELGSPEHLSTCAQRPCKNGGTCLDVDDGYRCVCHGKYSGRQCENDLDPCGSQPCLFGGKCVVIGKENNVIQNLDTGGPTS